MIPRFTPSFEHNGAGGQSVMRRADAEGEWVRYADYLAMEARVAVMEGQVRMMADDLAEHLPP